MAFFAGFLVEDFFGGFFTADFFAGFAGFVILAGFAGAGFSLAADLATGSGLVLAGGATTGAGGAGAVDSGELHEHEGDDCGEDDDRDRRPDQLESGRAVDLRALQGSGAAAGAFGATVTWNGRSRVWKSTKQVPQTFGSAE